MTAAYKELHGPAILVAGFCAMLAFVLSMFLIFQHLRSYNNPAEQKWIVAVLFIVPIYSGESIISLYNPKTSLACDILRNCYEAYALYAFGSYLIACLGGEEIVPRLLEDEARSFLNKPLLEGDAEPGSHPKSFRNFFLQPCTLGEKLFSIIKFGLVQYIILKTACAFLTLVLEFCGVYGDGQFKWYYGYPYITVVLNFSQMWALYCLVQFYNVTHERLKAIKPLAKFISFKAIVFATWWQGVGIVLLCTLGVLPKEEKFQTGLQDFLICIEVESKDKGPTVIEKAETEVNAPGTSIKESVQDIVVEGGQQVVGDVKLTINQAIQPVEKGVTKIQESFHEITAGSDAKQESDVEIERHVEEDQPGGKSHLASEKMHLRKL